MVKWTGHDYVFENNYKLPSFPELEPNKHLPGVPTAREVKENGEFRRDEFC